MKTHLIKIIEFFILLQFLGVQSINSQDQILKSKYKTWLVTTPERILNDSVSIENLPYAYQKMYKYQTFEGHLYQMKDSTISFANSLNPASPGFSKEFEIRNIDVIKVRRNGRVLKGALIGAVSGLVLGAVIGGATIDDSVEGLDSLGEPLKPIFGALLGTLVGTGVGIAIGSMKVSIPINGNQSTYEEQKIKLEKYLIR